MAKTVTSQSLNYQQHISSPTSFTNINVSNVLILRNQEFQENSFSTQRWCGQWRQIYCLENLYENICLFLARRGQSKTIVTADTICIARQLDVGFQSFTITSRTLLFIRSPFGIIYNHCSNFVLISLSVVIILRSYPDSNLLKLI